MEEIEGNSFISVDQIYDIAHAVQHEDLSDEMAVRSLVRGLINLAGRPVLQGKEDEIHLCHRANNVPVSMDSLNRFFKIRMKK